MHQRGFIQLFILLVLVLGMAVGVGLLQQKQLFSPKASSSGVCDQFLAKILSPAFIKIANDGTYLGYTTFFSPYYHPARKKHRYLLSVFKRESFDKGLTWTCPQKVASPPNLDSVIVEGFSDPQLSSLNKFLAIGRIITGNWQPEPKDPKFERTDSIFGDTVIIYPSTNWESLHEFPIIGFDPTNQKLVNSFTQSGINVERRYDNLYSPWVPPKTENSNKVDFYFHGWQGEIANSANLPNCGPSGSIGDFDNYVMDYDYCKCDLADSSTKLSYSACTADKIFYATNTGSDNDLAYQVFSGNPKDANDNSLNGSPWLSETWSPILTSRLVRKICEKPYCDYLGHVGDEMVLKLPSGKYVMYFNGEMRLRNSAGNLQGRSGIYVVVSSDPIHFAASPEGVKPLRKKDGTFWYDPQRVKLAGTNYPEVLIGHVFSSNSAFSAVYDPDLGKIVMIAKTTELPAESGENDKTYRFLINPDNPYDVEEVTEINLEVAPFTPIPTLPKTPTPTSAPIPTSLPTPTSSCQAYPQSPTTKATSGKFRIYATGVSNAKEVLFPTWTVAGGQDDIVWYQGTNEGGGNWHADIDLVNHSEAGLVGAHVWIKEENDKMTFCGKADFTKEVSSDQGCEVCLQKLNHPSCASACQAWGHGQKGVCGKPGSTDPSQCCACFP